MEIYCKTLILTETLPFLMKEIVVQKPSLLRPFSTKYSSLPITRIKGNNALINLMISNATESYS
jgi:hypothetical protein